MKSTILALTCCISVLSGFTPAHADTDSEITIYCSSASQAWTLQNTWAAYGREAFMEAMADYRMLYEDAARQAPCRPSDTAKLQEVALLDTATDADERDLYVSSVITILELETGYILTTKVSWQ